MWAWLYIEPTLKRIQSQPVGDPVDSDPKPALFTRCGSFVHLLAGQIKFVCVPFKAFTELLLEQDLASNPIPVQVRLHQPGRKVILHFTRKVVSEKYKSVRCKNFFSRRWDQDSCTCLCNPASRTSCSTGYIFDNTFRCSCVQVCTCNGGILVPARTDRLANTGRGSSHLPN